MGKEATIKFIEDLEHELSTLCDKYESDIEENKEKIDLFSEYKKLFQTYMMRLSESEYDVNECKGSLTALGSVCQKRLDKIVDMMESDDVDITEDLSVDEMKSSVSKLFDSLGTGLTATIVKADIFRIIANLTSPSESEINEALNKLSQLADLEIDVANIKVNADMEDDIYREDLGCSMREVRLLENLMGPFSEFDHALGR